MWPSGEYDRLVHEIKRRENPDIPVTFGLLIADYEQQSCGGYILNYIERFNYNSSNYINFYLPGYLEEKCHEDSKIIIINDMRYYFNGKIYSEFLVHLENDFRIEYPYNPVLILWEYDKGNFLNTQRIVIQLDSDGSQIKQTGKLFETIFSIAREEVAINDFSKRLIKGKVKSDLFSTIVNCIDNSCLTAI